MYKIPKTIKNKFKILSLLNKINLYHSTIATKPIIEIKASKYGDPNLIAPNTIATITIAERDLINILEYTNALIAK